MRKPNKLSKRQSVADKDFERLYKTIPDYRRAPAGAERPRDNTEGQAPAASRWKKLFKRVCIVVLLLILLIGIWLGWKFVSNNVKIFGWQGLIDMFKTTKLRGEDEGRVNILLAGNSADDPGHEGAELTDSIMLVSINTESKSGYIISIPRDLYLDIPGFGYAKINEAYQDGKRATFSEPGYPEGGMGLLEKTITEHLGIGIHYYALVNYTALKESVDAVGGIKVTIESSDPRGLRDPSPDYQNNRKPLVDLPNGTVMLDGTAALGLARARGNASGSYGYGQSDFTRTENQRKILIGLKEKAISLGTLSNPVRLGQLMDSMGDNVETDFKTSELRRLYALSKEIPATSIVSASINDAAGKNLLQSYRTRRGQSALVPAAGIDDYSEIQTYLLELSAGR